MPQSSPILVTKASGKIVPFSEDKLINSLLRVGANKETAIHILEELKPKLYHGVATRKIYSWAFGLLKKQSRPAAAKYHLKRAIAELGPSGFPFEKYIGELLKSQGYAVAIGLIMQGTCVSHEIDIVAQTETLYELHECKFHNHQGVFCEVKVPLYVQSRFKDVEQVLEKNPKKTYYGGVVTNTRFSTDAIRYGNCVGLKLLSWDYPNGKGIKDLADSLSLYPVTCMTSLSKTDKTKLLEKGIVLCQQIHDDPKLLIKNGVRESSIKSVLEEVEHLCRN